MAKKSRKKDPLSLGIWTAFGGIVCLNVLTLYIHNSVLPWLYVLLGGLYVLVAAEISNSEFDFTATIQKMFIGKKTNQVMHWVILVYAPVLVTLYYLDFALSCATLLVLGLANYYVLKERK